VLLGIGMAGNLIGSMKLMGLWFSPREFATVAGAFAALGTLGNVLATSPLALLVGRIGWRHAFVVFGAATAVLALAFFAVVRERPEDAQARAPDGSADAVPVGTMVRQLLSTRDFWLISFGAFCRYGSFVSIQALWAGPYLVEVVCLPPLHAANLILLLNVAFVVGAPLGGWLSDRLLSSRKKLVLVALGGTAAAELALALTGSAPSAGFVALVLAMLGVTSSFGQVIWPHIRDRMPARMAGMAMSGVNFFNILGAAAFLHGTGWVLESWSGPGGARGADGYRAAFLVGSSIVVVALGLYSLTRDGRVQAPVPERPQRAWRLLGR
jgi:nitrate/nitrite transporter NarK